MSLVARWQTEPVLNGPPCVVSSELPQTISHDSTAESRVVFAAPRMRMVAAANAAVGIATRLTPSQKISYALEVLRPWTAAFSQPLSLGSASLTNASLPSGLSFVRYQSLRISS